MKTIKSILKMYKISEALFKEEDKINLIILKRDGQFTLNDWVNLVSTIKFVYKKNVEFLINKDYYDLTKFTLIREIDYE